jgi:hypothetical protein
MPNVDLRYENIMKFHLIILCCVTIFSCGVSFAQDDCILKGKWKSNAIATKKDMEKNNVYTKEGREKIAKELFGRLTVEYTCSDYTTNFDGQTYIFGYKILKRNGNSLTVLYIDRECEDNNLEQEIILNGDCYSVKFETLGYSEIFCKIK